MSQFTAVFESLVELLCEASSGSKSPGLDETYESLRLEFLLRYTQVKQFVSAFLVLSPADGEVDELGRAPDPFEVLIKPSTLGDWLKLDDYTTIGRITRSREAINLYSLHLRQLAKLRG